MENETKLLNELMREITIERVQKDPEFAKSIAEDYCDMIEQDLEDKMKSAKFIAIIGFLSLLLGATFIIAVI